MVEKILSRSVRLMFVSGIMMGASITAQTVNAQEAGKEVTQRVEVLGSSIKRLALENALPVQTFSQKDIAKTGVTTTTDFIQQLPVMQGFTVAADSVGGGGGGLTTASIHDIGAAYTLVLVNGRRLAPATSGTTVDLNSIPLAAVERVEVLTDGASALYGADAIAGVINFVLKKGAKPLEITFKTTRPQHPGGSGSAFGISKGFGDIEEDGYSIFLSASHDQQKQLKAADRSFAKTGIIDFNDPKTGKPLRFFNGSSRSIPANATVRDAASKAIVNINPYQKANGKCAPSHLDAFGDGQCWFDYTTTVEIQPELGRDSVSVAGELKLGSTGFKAFADLMYTNSSVLARIAPYPAEFKINAGTPLFTKYITPYLTPAQAAIATSATVKYRLFELGGRAYDYGNKSTHFVTGVDGSAMGWDVNAAVTYSTNKQSTDYKGGFPLADKFTAAANAGTIDPFGTVAGSMPQTMVAALRATQYLGNYSTQTITMKAADARASREVFKLSGGSAMLGVGVDYRTTDYGIAYSDVAKAGSILFDDAQKNNGYKRGNGGAYAELVMPITKEIEATASGRYDRFTGVKNSTDGKTYGGNEGAATYKLSAKWTPRKDLLVRASVGSGFRVASMSDIASPVQDFGVTGGTYNCPLTAANNLANHPLAKYCEGRNQFEAFSGGNKDLKPEHSKQWVIGTVFEPTSFMSVGLDLWSVKIKDQVSSVSEALYFSNPNKYIDLFTTKFKASTGTQALAIKFIPINIGKVENQGLDYDVTVRAKLFNGKLTSRLAGTYLIESRYTTPGTDDQWETSLNRYGSNSAVSFRNVIRLSNSFDIGSWTHTAAFNYRNGYQDKHHDVDNCAVTTNDANGDCVDVKLNVPSYTTMDWQTVYRFSKNLDLTAGVVNVTDRTPPFSLRNTGSHQLGYNPSYSSPMGRTYYISGAYKF
jgi:iron complex outermembrane receptor protein